MEARTGTVRIHARLLVHGAIMVGLWGMPDGVIANDVIDDCGQTCEVDCGSDPSCRKAVNGKCKLTADVSCDDTESTIELLSGNDLEMQGYDINCTETSPDECNYAAITMSGTGSKVTSDNSGEAEAVIDGRFDTIIDCASKTASQVEDISVFDGFIALKNCAKVDSVVIGPSSQGDPLYGTTFGISTAGVAGTDFIKNSYISGRVFSVFHSGSTTYDVQNNVFHTDTTLTAVTIGSGQTGTINGNAKFNIFFSDGFSSVAKLFTIGGTDSVNFDGNFCDEDHPDCADCITDDRCEPYTSPFAGN